MKSASAETASPAGGVACRGFRLFRPQLTGGIKDLPILGLRHGLAVGDEHLQMLDGLGDVDVQARSGSGGGTGAAFDEREDVLFLDLRAESRMRHVVEMFRDDLDRAGHPSEMLSDFQ